MTQHVRRWLSCDFPGCGRTFGSEHQRSMMIATGRTFTSLKGAALAAGWLHSEADDDLCREHADLHLQRPEQPSLFPDREGDHSV